MHVQSYLDSTSLSVHQSQLAVLFYNVNMSHLFFVTQVRTRKRCVFSTTCVVHTAIGENPTEEELFRFMADIDEDGGGQIEFSEFLRAFEKQRVTTTEHDDEQDTSEDHLSCLTGPVPVNRLSW
eukprot:GHVQ01015623.1.p1 GENE.GHVQ01015623.1~~GHVQ01015623.1.p1  ORF type:complete len:124 (-),score=17.46 GHVQ01015623.1:613-984(-)